MTSVYLARTNKIACVPHKSKLKKEELNAIKLTQTHNDDTKKDEKF